MFHLSWTFWEVLYKFNCKCSSSKSISVWKWSNGLLNCEMFFSLWIFFYFVMYSSTVTCLIGIMHCICLFMTANSEVIFFKSFGCFLYFISLYLIGPHLIRHLTWLVAIFYFYWKFQPTVPGTVLWNKNIWNLIANFSKEIYSYCFFTSFTFVIQILLETFFALWYITLSGILYGEI